MRTYSFDLTTGKPVRLYTLTREDGTVYRFTSWDRAITIPGDATWQSVTGLLEYDVTESKDGTPASTAIGLATLAGGLIDPVDVALGLFRRAVLEVHIANAANPTAKDFHFIGKVTAVDQSSYDAVVFEADNHHAFPRNKLVDTFQLHCRYAFGNTFCGIPVMRPDVARSTAYAIGGCVRALTGASPAGYGNVYFEVVTAGTTAASMPTYNYTIGALTTDGSVVFIARNAWERACTIDTVQNHHNLTLTELPDPRAIDGWYNPGKITFASGRYKNRTFKIGYWTQSDLRLITFQPVGICVQAGDTALIWPDCNKTPIMCHDKYDNSLRHGGFSRFAGAKAASSSDPTTLTV